MCQVKLTSETLSVKVEEMLMFDTTTTARKGVQMEKFIGNTFLKYVLSYSVNVEVNK